jgi:hypothetical protein
MNEARTLVEKKMWNLSIVEAYRSLELSIDKKLLELGMDAKRIPFSRSTDILSKYGILTANEINNLNYIRDLRNKAVHTSMEFTEEEASEVIKMIKDILPKLETKTTSSLFFEKEIIEILGGEKGLFPKNQTIIQQEAGFDIEAIGHDYKYLI